MKKTLSTIVAALAIATAGSAQAQKACIWDLMGTSGDVYTNAKDFALQAKAWGVPNLELKVYTDERVATEDFKNGQCDMVSVTGLRAKQFNAYTGTFDAIGAVPNNKVAKTLITALMSPAQASRMVQGDYEIAGMLPMGSVYLFVRDKSINTLAKAAGKKIAVLDFDKSQAKMVQRIGAQPVASEVSNFAAKFNNGQVDIIASPALAYRPLELNKGLGTNGAIAPVPVLHLSGAMIIRKSKFPAGFGQKARSFAVTQIDRVLAMAEKEKNAIPSKYWMQIPAADNLGYVKLMREARIDLANEGYYDKSFLKLAKGVRCKVDPASFECALTDE